MIAVSPSFTNPMIVRRDQSAHSTVSGRLPHVMLSSQAAAHGGNASASWTVNFL